MDRLAVSGGEADEVQVSRALFDDAWDTFVDRAPGGTHLQTTAWATVKATAGWRATRVVVSRDGAVVGGCQILLRALPLVGSVGYVPRGPLFEGDDPARLPMVLDALARVAAEERMAYLKVQPPPGGEGLVPALRDRGFAPSTLEAAPTATVRIALDRPEADILARMRKSVRNNIAGGVRKGVTIREGDEHDLPVLAELVAATSERQGFAPYPPGYYAAIWRSFHPGGRVKLFLAEHDRRVLSALLLVGYGDSVVYKMGGWSGARHDIHPNELAHWTAIRWARDHGYRYYDLEGIDLPTARTIAGGEVVPRGEMSGLTSFKLGFGGDVVVFPGAHDYSHHRALAVALRPLASALSHSNGLAHRIVGRSHR
jgi:lipid II:glycine glycyltransferase (peptidoglycan interpeptide bridge formation enzyme)